jgi:hypothetical protein
MIHTFVSLKCLVKRDGNALFRRGVCSAAVIPSPKKKPQSRIYKDKFLPAAPPLPQLNVASPSNSIHAPSFPPLLTMKRTRTGAAAKYPSSDTEPHRIFETKYSIAEYIKKQRKSAPDSPSPPRHNLKTLMLGRSKGEQNLTIPFHFRSQQLRQPMQNQHLPLISRRFFLQRI